jgi:hypothetical protein
MRVLRARSLILSPSNKSIARHTLPSRPALQILSGSGRLATIRSRRRTWPFPHPQYRKEHYRNDHKPNAGGVLWKFFKRTINIAEYRNAKFDMNPAMKRVLFHDSCMPNSSVLNRPNTLLSMFWIAFSAELPSAAWPAPMP